jgi:hypothetical protein
VDRVEWLKGGLRAFHIGIFLIESHLPFPVAYSTSMFSLTHSYQLDVTSIFRYYILTASCTGSLTNNTYTFLD